MLHQVSYRWSMLSVSVSFTHTIKTLGPMFTIFFSRLLLAERMPISRLLSVLPVVLGVAITTSTEVEFALVPPTRAQHTSGLHALHRSPQPAARSPQPAARSPQPRPPQPAARSPAPQPSPRPHPRQVGFCCAMSSTVCQVRLYNVHTRLTACQLPPPARHQSSRSRGNASTLRPRPYTGATVGAVEASSGRRACLQA